MTVAIVLAGALAASAVFAVIRYPLLHPLQLWCVPWTIGTGLFALHLLPYRPLSASTALLIVGATVAYCLGALCAAQAATQRRRLSSRSRSATESASSDRPLELAAAVAFGLTMIGLALFLAQLVVTFGLRDALVTAPEVRMAIGQGTASLTIKYLYIAYAAAALCGVAAGRTNSVRRRFWIALGVITVVSQYFTTGRSNIVLVAFVLVVAEAVARRREPPLRALLAAGAAATAFALLVFSAGGAIIGKTLENNALGEIASPLTEKRALRPFALPYQYASAPIAALERQVNAARRTEDTRGCASFALVCTVAARAGADVVAEPTIRPFTKPPLPWNTYTAIDLPLLDGGPVFVIAFFALAGAWLGWLWQCAREGIVLALGLYGIYAPVVLYSVTQNNFFAPHIVGAVLLVVAFLWLGRALTTGHRARRIRRALGEVRSRRLARARRGRRALTGRLRHQCRRRS